VSRIYRRRTGCPYRLSSRLSSGTCPQAVPRAIGQGQARDPARLAASLEEFAGHPAYGLDQLPMTWSASPSCPAAATASPCSARRASHEQDDVVNEPIPHPVDHGDMLLGREPGHDDAAAVLLVDHVIPGYDPAGDVRP
jgi:hypothetical protein